MKCTWFGGERTFYICRPLATDTKPQEFEILLLRIERCTGPDGSY